MISDCFPSGYLLISRRNEFNRAIVLGCIITLGEEDTRRRGSGVLGSFGGPRQLVLVGVSAADKKQPVSNRLLSECLFSRSLILIGGSTTDGTSSAVVLL